MSFSRYNSEDQVVSSETVVRGLWSNDQYSLSTFFTASAYNEYYLDVYNGNPSNSGSYIQFDIQFGHINGSGSSPINAAIPGNTPSRIIYGQYRNLVYGTETTNFSFDNGTTTANGIYIINISRARYKEYLNAGSLNLRLKNGGGTVQLTDDSGTTNLARFVGENRYYNIISGSNGSYYTTGNPSIYYGMFLPDLGVIILNSGSIAPYIGATTSNNNHIQLYQSISSSAAAGFSFQLQSVETISSTYFFTRVKNSEFNYTTNPSIIDNNGNLLYTTLINSPQTFPTTVGLYNDNNELLAVAKMSKPLAKDFTKEALIRIKLDY
jgi:hypothetical protein